MAKPQIMHALLAEPEDGLVPGMQYLTLCGIYWEHQSIPLAEIRTRFVCAMCHDKQIGELLAAITDLQENYNLHLNAYHPQRIE